MQHSKSSFFQKRGRNGIQVIKQPSNQATKQPSNQATKQPSNQATKQPS
ncbi:PT domain-containing protein, partial [Helicobacter pylori]|nr:PT domain-containing protein [Helicobacter pylori]